MCVWGQTFSNGGSGRISPPKKLLLMVEVTRLHLLGCKFNWTVTTSFDLSIKQVEINNYSSLTYRIIHSLYLLFIAIRKAAQVGNKIAETTSNNWE
jgi:hypothetical protein